MFTNFTQGKEKDLIDQHSLHCHFFPQTTLNLSIAKIRSVKTSSVYKLSGTKRLDQLKLIKELCSFCIQKTVNSKNRKLKHRKLKKNINSKTINSNTVNSKTLNSNTVN